jgi:hypothetical protein
MANRSAQSTFCSASARATADRILHELKVGGYSADGISVVFLDRAAQTAGADATAVAGTGSSSTEIRGVIAWIASVRTAVIRGAAPLIVGGPVAAAFKSSTTGGIAGGLMDFGMPDAEAHRYEARIQQGQILIGVHHDNPEACARARDIFATVGAEDVFTMMQVFTPRSTLLHTRAPARAQVA